jgi:hypothetical protein
MTTALGVAEHAACYAGCREQDARMRWLLARPHAARPRTPTAYQWASVVRQWLLSAAPKLLYIHARAMATIRVLPWRRVTVAKRGGKQFVEFSFAVDMPGPSGRTQEVHKISGRYSELRSKFKPLPAELLPGCRAHFPDKFMRGGPNDRNLHQRARELAQFFATILVRAVPASRGG